MARSAASPSTPKPRLPGMKIGLFGGSFNPVHNGHLKLAEFARAEFNLDKVYFIPSHRTPLKKDRELLPAPVRMACLRGALRKKKGFAVSSEEVRRGGTSYTVDTLKSFRRLLGPKTVFYFLAGADAARNLSLWKSPSEVLKLCRFTILSRPGSRPKVENARRLPAGRQVLWAAFPALKVSSSDIRRRLAQGRSVRGLVPGPVEKTLLAFKRKAGFLSTAKRK